MLWCDLKPQMTSSTGSAPFHQCETFPADKVSAVLLSTLLSNILSVVLHSWMFVVSWCCECQKPDRCSYTVAMRLICPQRRPKVLVITDFFHCFANKNKALRLRLYLKLREIIENNIVTEKWIWILTKQHHISKKYKISSCTAIRLLLTKKQHNFPQVSWVIDATIPWSITKFVVK